MKKQKILKEFIICIDCGKKVQVTSMQQKKERCADCAYERQLVASRESNRKRYQDQKKKKSKQPLCSCGCGRPRGKTLRMLSNYCYANKTEKRFGVPI